MPSDLPCFDPAALRAARARIGLTQRAVALALGVAGGERVSAWEAGRGTPRDTQLAELAKVVGVSVDDLVPGECGLRLLRFRAGLSAPALAAAVGVSVRTIFRWEAGEYVQVPRGEILDRVAASLGVDAVVVGRAFRQGKV